MGDAMNIAIPIRVSERNRRLLEPRTAHTFPASGRVSWLFFDLSRPERLGITLTYIKALALEGYVGLQRIPRASVVRQ